MKNQYEYFFHNVPEALEELKTLGISFQAIDVGENDLWPALILPSGIALLIIRDDEGNGPGSIEPLSSIK
jgi:hypothetical protein